MHRTDLARILYVCACASLLIASPASAQPSELYPRRPVRMVLPQPPGGAVDLISRALSLRLSDALGQPFVVENRPGANGIIAAELIANAVPDGYNLLMVVDTNLVVNPTLYTKIPYDPFRDFTPISIIAKGGLALVAHPSVPASTVQELIAFAKSKPHDINYASLGSGTQQHLGMELFKAMAGIELTHIPYKGTAAAMSDLLAGTIAIMFSGMPSALAQSKSQRVKLLAVTSAQRSNLAPQLPTMAESGVPGFELTAWWGLLGPAKLPPEILGRLVQEVTKATNHPEFRNTLIAQGIDPLGTSPETMLSVMRSDTEKWSKVIHDSGSKAQ